MKVYIKCDGSYYKKPNDGLTSNIKKAHVYDYKQAEKLLVIQGEKIGVSCELIPVNLKKKILILGDCSHGKDTLAEMICEHSDLTFASSSQTALDIFLQDVLKEKYGLSYNSKEEAYEDRVNHRDKWYDEICLYNQDDKLRLVKDILKIADIYVGLRNGLEVEQAITEESFDYIIGIYDYRKSRESSNSNTADVLKYSDFVILNNGTLKDLQQKVFNIVLKVIL